MRTTWIILIVTVLAGAGLYFYFSRKKPPGASDTVSIVNTPDSIIRKTRIFIADDPVEVFYRDSLWQMADSTPLREVLKNAPADTMNKNYPERTLYISYDHKWFYDMQIAKKDTAIGYDIALELHPQNDSIIIVATIDQKLQKKTSFSNPMIRMYRSFVLTYNNKLPDSLRNDSSTQGPGPVPSKTITVLEP
jgi:hypothetical protein